MSVPTSDPGLQPERTALAWRRTTSALTLCSVAAARVLGPALGRWALLAGLGGLVATVVVAVLSRRRHERGSTPPDGRVVALTAGLVLAGAVVAAAWVVGRAVG